MYAIVEIAGQQFKVSKDQQLFVHRLEGKEGSKVTFSNVLLIDDNGKVNVGAPAVAGASISVKILEHLKGDKVIVFKKRRRKGYKVKNGHRQYLTKIQVEGISEKGGVKPTAEKAEPKVEVIAKAPKAEVTTAKKEAAPKADVKKPAVKKAAPKAAPKAAAKKPTKKEDK
ncbi:MAG: 50S ribosomal protein L21 [Flavobacteriales bacterium CG_4_10_14_0_2_um_filter_32_8]|nr:MAG: 50S ribosomal protein L21 [Flavobacteriales bacterium CG_4_10_14_0_2_um_filter_32_8]